ncbi:hypothetical protein SSX86_025347 [Deinandra increscens subsp. villosa]|uniref:Uncharacterized protein n=1 Tax=Deinandra increscens subsp. villosa TaxID=3103831 RepID=A0AAP0GN48_9ASTR
MMEGMMEDAVKDGMMDGMMDGGSAKVVKTTSVAEERRDVWRLNEKLKRLNAYSSALNLSTLVVLTWHIAYMGQLLQAAR